MCKDRKWTVLFIGGPSGTGKSSVAYELARFYEVNVVEVDDIYQAVKASTTREILPAVHYWDSGQNWMDARISDNVDWLINVSKEMIPGLSAVVDNHLETDAPIIIEGDFIDPGFTVSFKNPKVKSLFVRESDGEQILRNYLAREGGDPQHYRAAVSAAYGNRISDACGKLGIPLIESRPWDTVIDRVVACLA